LNRRKRTDLFPRHIRGQLSIEYIRYVGSGPFLQRHILPWSQELMSNSAIQHTPSVLHLVAVPPVRHFRDGFPSIPKLLIQAPNQHIFLTRQGPTELHTQREYFHGLSLAEPSEHIGDRFSTLLAAELKAASKAFAQTINCCSWYKITRDSQCHDQIRDGPSSQFSNNSLESRPETLNRQKIWLICGQAANYVTSFFEPFDRRCTCVI
jgi:hypothetical protein